MTQQWKTRITEGRQALRREQRTPLEAEDTHTRQQRQGVDRGIGDRREAEVDMIEDDVVEQHGHRRRRPRENKIGDARASAEVEESQLRGVLDQDAHTIVGDQFGTAQVEFLQVLGVCGKRLEREVGVDDAGAVLGARLSLRETRVTAEMEGYQRTTYRKSATENINMKVC